MFLTPFAAQASASSAIVDEGVIGKIAQTSLTRYAMCAAAVFPSITTDFTDIRILLQWRAKGTFANRSGARTTLWADGEASGHSLGCIALDAALDPGLGRHVDGMTRAL